MYFARDKRGRVLLREYDPTTKRPRTLPRAESKHLDAMTDDQVQAILDLQNEGVNAWYLTDPVYGYLKRWVVYSVSRGLDLQTVRQHESAIRRFVFEYFGAEAERRDPKLWPKYCGQFYNWMIVEKGYTHNQLRIANIALRKFYQWMGEENLIPSVELKLRSPIAPNVETPLPRPVLPEEVLEWADKCESVELKFMGLVGYFMTLRPQEAFALTPAHFRAGSQVHILEACVVMKAAELYNSFAVYIGKQRHSSGKITDKVKKDSKGWVCCFDERGAKAIVEILKTYEPETVVTKWNIRKLYKMWAEHGLPNITPKDLRRASCYYLGHHTKLQPMQLMKHARHKGITTTMLYCRQPDKGLFGNSGSLDLES